MKCRNELASRETEGEEALGNGSHQLGPASTAPLTNNQVLVARGNCAIQSFMKSPLALSLYREWTIRALSSCVTHFAHFAAIRVTFGRGSK